MNSKNNKTSDPHGWVSYLTNKINFNGTDKYIVLLNLISEPCILQRENQ